MRENLKHIELIDKYLNGTLNPSEKETVEKLLLNDTDFANEVAVYKKVYEGIAQKGEADLKKRLEGYFEEYKKDQKNIIDNEPRGKYRRLFIYASAVAASLVIGAAILFFNNVQPTTSNPDPNIVDTDSTTIQKSDSIFDLNEEKLVEEQKKDKPIIDKVGNDTLIDRKKDDVQLPNTVDDVQLALGGFETLPSTSIRRYSYSKTLSYTFNEGTFKLFGDPLMGRLDLLSLRIQKNKDSNYLLSLKNNYYAIERTERRMRLRKADKEQGNNGFGALFGKSPKLVPTQEELLVTIATIENASYVLSELIVRFKQGSAKDKTYFFNNTAESLELIINADLNKENTKVYRIEESGQHHYFLVQKNQIYALDVKAKEPTPLVLADITTNKLARLFIEREPIKAVVYKVK
ncbi:hypothetical protein [Costertonia aggregata]|uniref:Uncharacterized protein n=1 Tax=Costertonia aggregata TaxID=343403 RepID=A0A7H9ANN5_9FLAO|nr:hypothetical protein [Costertonia aggregata]QLG45071.1 hypothetical protein HYG79_06810 [Costertonia aggregata]